MYVDIVITNVFNLNKHFFFSSFSLKKYIIYLSYSFTSTLLSEYSVPNI